MNRLSPKQATASPTVPDLVLAGGLLIVAILSGVYEDAARPGTIEPTAWWHWALIMTPALLVGIRRFNPVVVTAAATVAQVLIWVNDLPEFLLAMIVILFTAASDGGRAGIRTAITASVVLTGFTIVGLRLAADVSVYQVPLVALTCWTAIILGANAARQRSREAELASAVTTARLQGEHERHKAITDERSAIARELHDIVGHTLATIAVRAEAADRVAANKPEAATEAIAAIANTARSSLDETRRVLAGLRANDVAELAPPPDISSLRTLVADLQGAGATIALTENGCNDHQPPAVVLAGAYRIVQESLTNAIKHGGPDSVIEVALTCSATSLDIVVVNTAPNANGEVDRDGNGVNGMAERAYVLGGTFSAQRTGDRFTVAASLPTTNRN